MRTPQRLVPIVSALCLLASLLVARPIGAETSGSASCPLTVGKPYRDEASSTVYMVTEGCKKRPIFNPDVYFSYFTDWKATTFVSEKKLTSVPNHELNFLPWGPRKEFKNGSLVKNVEDPKVYLLEEGKAYPIDSESAFKSLGYSFNQVEDVSSDVLGKFTKQTEAIHGVSDAPSSLAFKYPDDPKVYILKNENGETVKSHVATLDELKTVARPDRIAVLPREKTFRDATESAVPTTTTEHHETASPEHPVTEPVHESTPPPVPEPTTTPSSTDAVAPTVSFTSPNSGATVSGMITITANAADNVGVASVRFLIGASGIETDRVAPYSQTFDTTKVADGSYVLSAVAKDAVGNTTTATRNITIANGTTVPPVTPPVVTPPPTPPPAPSTPPPTGIVNSTTASLGINLGGLADYESSTPFVDVFSTARDFIDMNWGSANGIITSRDANGWPTAITAPIQTILIDALPYPHGGTYVLRWEGDGSGLSLGLDGKNLRCDTGATALGTCTSHHALFDMSAAGSLTVKIASINAADPVKNIRILQPGGVCGTSPSQLVMTESCASSRGGAGSCSSGETCYDFDAVSYNRFADPVSDMATKVVFHPVFLKSLQGFRTLRFMDWAQTNGSPVTDWASRATLQRPTFTSPKGVPVEMMVAIANATGADAWFNMPHKVMDDFVTQFAAYVRDHLNTSLHAYVEYSNETWNGQFTQAAYVIQQGKALGLPTGNGDFGIGRYYTIDRTAQIGNIFKTVIGASRVTSVFGAWAGNAWWSNEALKYLTKDGQTAKVHGIDAIAIAPYFGGYLDSPSCQSKLDVATVDDIFNELNGTVPLTGCSMAGGAMTQAEQFMKDNAAYAKTYNVDLLGYEGGPHLVGIGGMENDQKVTTLFQSVNRDPRMKPLLLDYLNRWKNAGGNLFTYFTHMGAWSKWGSWGSMEDMMQTRAQAPKYDALQTFLEQNACWWTGCTR